MRSKFDEQLELLNNSLIKMGSIVEQAISDANKALINQNVELARKIIASDDKIDDKEKEIESLCLNIILRQQPVAGDLRLVSSILKLITDLERIGDHATDISEITILLSGRSYMKNMEEIPQMAKATMEMVTKSIDSFVKKDLELAREVIKYDDVVDNLFIAVKKDLIEMIKENTDDCDQAIDLIMIAKYFERIGDHAVNIAEWVIFSLTGEHKDSQIM